MTLFLVDQQEQKHLDVVQLLDQAPTHNLLTMHDSIVLGERTRCLTANRSYNTPVHIVMMPALFVKDELL